MKYWLPTNWDKSFDYEGLLFFVQKMQELLYFYTDDIHRAPVHNTSTLCYEFLHTHAEVRSGKVNSKHLNEIFQEIKYSFSHDAIIKSYLGSDFVEQVSSKLNACQEHDHYKYVNYLDNLLNMDYYGWVVEFLKRHIQHGSHKEEIISGARCWIADIIMQGYSAEFIYSFLEDTFISKKVSSLDVLDTFFNRFDFSKRKFKVYMFVSDNVVKFSDILNKRLSLKFEDDGNFKKIKTPPKFNICYLEIVTIDPNTAAEIAYRRINIFFKYYKFISNSQKSMLKKTGYIFDEQTSEIYKLPILPNRVKAIEFRGDSTIVNTIDAIILGIKDQKSSAGQIINKAIELHNSALRQELPKDGLINFWSILEVLCPTSNEKSKLDSIIDSTIPVLQNDFFYGKFKSIYSDLRSNLNKADFSLFLSKINEKGVINKIAAFCLLPEYENLREEQFTVWSDFPLIRHKIFTLYTLRNNKKNFFSLSTFYAQRVKWHLCRIYRERNAIVHSGESTNSVRVLCEHLHLYVDNILNELVYKLASNNALSDINSVFVDTQMLIDSKAKHFSESSLLTKDDIDILLKDFFIPIANS